MPQDFKTFKEGLKDEKGGVQEEEEKGSEQVSIPIKEASLLASNKGGVGQNEIDEARESDE